METKEKPPYVAFEFVPVEDRKKTQETGKYTTRDVIYARVTRPGSKDTLVVEAEMWIQQMYARAKQQLCPDSWPRQFEEMLNLWKKGEELPVDGTPIKGWPILSPAAQQTIIQAGFRTVESLAEAPDAEAANIGMGYVELRNKARAWLEAANKTGTLATKLEDLTVKLSAAMDTIQKQSEELKRLQAQADAKK